MRLEILPQPYIANTYDFYKNLYVVAYQQNLHFKQLFKKLELLGYDWAKDCVHVPFGMVSLEGVGAMSTREGKVVKLKDVLSEAVDKTKAIISQKNPELENKDETAEAIGVERFVRLSQRQNKGCSLFRGQGA